MEKTNELFQSLWADYTTRNPEAKRVHDLFVKKGETVINDHIAFRTFNHPAISVDVLAQHFINVGYEFKGEYQFEQKHLYAKHFEHKTMKDAPRVFISQLKTEDFSEFLQEKVAEIVAKIPADLPSKPEVLTAGNVWEEKPSYEVYNKLREESEYAAWLYLYGFTVNHFTVSVTHLKKLNSMEKTNQFLKTNGFLMNDSGGEIKGTPAELLEQSSIKANMKRMQFQEGEFDVPVTYYEFAKRYLDADGKLYSGFIAKSADKIFESTDFYKK
jgi:hypothetical protein